MTSAGAARRVGIMGGTFDPIHFGHLRVAEEAREVLSLDEVIFVPAGNPSHKDGNITSAEDRYEMTVLATQGCQYFSVSRIETDFSGKSYTLDTLRKLKTMPEYFGAEFYFITGFDAVLDIMSWKQPEDIIKLCKFIAVSRSGYSRETFKELPENVKSSIIIIEMPMLVISSTDLRRRIAEHKSIKYLLPEKVENYIREKGLYV